MRLPHRDHNSLWRSPKSLWCLGMLTCTKSCYKALNSRGIRDKPDSVD